MGCGRLVGSDGDRGRARTPAGPDRAPARRWAGRPGGRGSARTRGRGPAGCRCGWCAALRTRCRPATMPRSCSRRSRSSCEGVDQVGVDGVLDDGVAVSLDAAHVGIDVGAHGFLLHVLSGSEPIVLRWPGSDRRRTIATSCSPAPGRAMPWWGPMPPRSLPRIGCGTAGGRYPLVPVPALRRLARRRRSRGSRPGPGAGPGRDRASRTGPDPAGPLRAAPHRRRSCHPCDRAQRPWPSSCSPSPATTPRSTRDYVDIMNDLSGSNPGEAQVRGVLGYLRKAFEYSPRHLIQLGLAGHRLRRPRGHGDGGAVVRQAVGGVPDAWWPPSLLIPIEIYELSSSVSVFKVITFVINVAIVVYLLLAKRLFGLRGGHRAEAGAAPRVQRLGGDRTGDSSACRRRRPSVSVHRQLACDVGSSRRTGPASVQAGGWYRRPPRAVGAVGSALA